MAYTPHTNWFTPENVQTGLCLMTVLDAVLDAQQTSVSNQPKSKRYKDDEAQAVEMEWEDDRHPEMPCNFWQHSVSVPIDLDLAPLDHPVIYKRTEITKHHNLLTVTSYQLPNVHAFVNLLDQLKQGRKDVLGLLKVVEVEEYDLKGLQTDMGMPRNLYDMAE